MNSKNTVPPKVGQNLKRERMRRHLTLGELAEISGISKAMLSQTENNRVNPTLALLWKAANALDIELSVLTSGQSSVPERFDKLTAEQQACIHSDDGKVEFKLLTAPGLLDGFEMYHVTLAPGAVHHSEPHATGSKEYVLIIKGCVQISCGKNTTTLQEGDFLAYHSDLPHSMENSTDSTARLHMTDLTPPLTTNFIHPAK